MKTSMIAIACIFMTLGMTLAMNYGGSYGGGYGYLPTFLPAQQQSGVPGVGEGGILFLFGFFILFLLLIGNNGLFNFTTPSNTVPVSIVG